jgi:hypothetical protein
MLNLLTTLLNRISEVLEPEIGAMNQLIHVLIVVEVTFSRLAQNGIHLFLEVLTDPRDRLLRLRNVQIDFTLPL